MIILRAQLYPPLLHMVQPRQHLHHSTWFSPHQSKSSRPCLPPSPPPPQPPSAAPRSTVTEPSYHHYEWLTTPHYPESSLLLPLAQLWLNSVVNKWQCKRNGIAQQPAGLRMGGGDGWGPAAQRHQHLSEYIPRFLWCYTSYLSRAVIMNVDVCCIIGVCVFSVKHIRWLEDMYMVCVQEVGAHGSGLPLKQSRQLPSKGTENRQP